MLEGDPIRRMGHQGQLGIASRPWEDYICMPIGYPGTQRSLGGWFGRRINPSLTTGKAMTVSQGSGRHTLGLTKRCHGQNKPSWQGHNVMFP